MWHSSKVKLGLCWASPQQPWCLEVTISELARQQEGSTGHWREHGSFVKDLALVCIARAVSIFDYPSHQPISRLVSCVPVRNVLGLTLDFQPSPRSTGKTRTGWV
jgi:hypothetical protein